MPRKKGQKNKKVSPYLILKKYRDDINRVLRPADYSYFIDNLIKGGYIQTTEEAIELIKNIIIPIVQGIIDQRIYQFFHELDEYLFSMIYTEGILLVTTFELPGEKYTRVEAGEIIYLVTYKHVEFQFIHSGEDQVENYHTRLCLPSKPVEDQGSWFIDEPARQIIGDSQITPRVMFHSLDLDEMPRHNHAIYSGWGDAIDPQTNDAYRYQRWALNDRSWKGYGTLGTSSVGGYNGGNAKPHGHQGVPETNDPKSMVLYYWLSRGTV